MNEATATSSSENKQSLETFTTWAKKLSKKDKAEITTFWDEFKVSKQEFKGQPPSLSIDGKAAIAQRTQQFVSRYLHRLAPEEQRSILEHLLVAKSDQEVLVKQASIDAIFNLADTQPMKPITSDETAEVKKVRRGSSKKRLVYKVGLYFSAGLFLVGAYSGLKTLLRSLADDGELEPPNKNSYTTTAQPEASDLGFSYAVGTPTEVAARAAGATSTPSVTETSSATASLTSTLTPTPTNTATVTESPAPTTMPTLTETPTSTATQTETVSPTETPQSTQDESNMGVERHLVSMTSELGNEYQVECIPNYIQGGKVEQIIIFKTEEIPLGTDDTLSVWNHEEYYQPDVSKYIFFDKDGSVLSATAANFIKSLGNTFTLPVSISAKTDITRRFNEIGLYDGQMTPTFGTDFDGYDQGTKLVAVADMEIVFIGQDTSDSENGLGSEVIVGRTKQVVGRDNFDREIYAYFIYGHGSANQHLVSRLNAEGPITVKAGEEIGLLGNSGYSTGPHLDFSIILGTENALRISNSMYFDFIKGGTNSPGEAVFVGISPYLDFLLGEAIDLYQESLLGYPPARQAFEETLNSRELGEDQLNVIRLILYGGPSAWGGLSHRDENSWVTDVSEFVDLYEERFELAKERYNITYDVQPQIDLIVYSENGFSSKTNQVFTELLRRKEENPNYVLPVITLDYRFREDQRIDAAENLVKATFTGAIENVDKALLEEYIAAGGMLGVSLDFENSTFANYSSRNQPISADKINRFHTNFLELFNYLFPDHHQSSIPFIIYDMSNENILMNQSKLNEGITVIDASNAVKLESKMINITNIQSSNTNPIGVMAYDPELAPHLRADHRNLPPGSPGQMYDLFFDSDPNAVQSLIANINANNAQTPLYLAFQ